MSAVAVSEEDLELDIDAISSNFRKCMAKNGCLYLDRYISAYHEVHNLLSRLGPVLAPLSADVRQKLVQLDCLRKGGAGTSYSTAEAMMEYETTGGLLTEDRTGNGCRTLLRLHRTLEFVCEFLRELCRLTDEERMTGACQAAYRRTLAAHHPWLGQKAALLAMYAMGTRGDTMMKLAPPSPRLDDQLSECADAMRQVHRQTQELLEHYQLTGLP